MAVTGRVFMRRFKLFLIQIVSVLDGPYILRYCIIILQYSPVYLKIGCAHAQSSNLVLKVSSESW